MRLLSKGMFLSFYTLILDTQKQFLIYVAATTELQKIEATDIWLDKLHSCEQAYKLNYLSISI